jgi:hypothetical protein
VIWTKTFRLWPWRFSAQNQSKIDFPVSKNKNVNPNFKSDLNENPNKTVCERCGAIHKWLAALCTSDRHQGHLVDADGNIVHERKSVRELMDKFPEIDRHL